MIIFSTNFSLKSRLLSKSFRLFKIIIFFFSLLTSSIKSIKIPPRNIQPMTASRAIEILQKVKDGQPGGLTVTEINEAFDMAIEKLKS